MANIASLELKGIGKGLLVRPHEASQLLFLRQLLGLHGTSRPAMVVPL